MDDYLNQSALLRSYAALTPNNPREIQTPPFPTSTWLSKHSNQLKLFNLLVSKQDHHQQGFNRKYIANGRQWKLMFWKRVILEIENGFNNISDPKLKEEEEIEEKILTYYISLQQSPPPHQNQTEGRGHEDEETLSPLDQTEIHTYYYGDLSDRDRWTRIDLHENKASISQGTTGLRSWGASVCLANYMILHPDLLADSTKVLELGSGTGLLGLLVHTLSPSTHVYLSDSNPAVLARLQLNINLNSLGDRDTLKLVELDWNADRSALPAPIDLDTSSIILGADVIYDPDLVPGLVRTIKLGLLSSHPSSSPASTAAAAAAAKSTEAEATRSYGLICGLVRDPSTWQKFIDTCQLEGLEVEEVEIDEAVEIGSVEGRGIVFPQALDRALLDLRMVRLSIRPSLSPPSS
ncbi:hypothetical protein PGT21_034337 [Puccinia graminis f. sp. tritici]|uniref:Uncharacterized protein n=1 Tax=Puccinia graminis f. sp. tritici TaxID=56615 RepID=A0A5B0N608_PUCGR|nr:hypothetical protein PGTUg99_015972 [Puccinia graminis f. sp. tritici]KAA1084695.1 hypothetical protein PGT21_034337 [Puccinia graminis f. sp. tritici]